MECATTWIQCGKKLCGKWRIAREEVARKYENLSWSCEMNENRRYSKCSVPEEEIEVGKGQKIVLTKFPYNNGEIVMAKMSGYCLWPALICPDPYCEFYYDAELNEKDEEDEITHIHVEFFGWPRTHAWVTPNNVSSFCETKARSGKPKGTKSSKLKKSYELATEEALIALSSSCEERLRNRTFKTVADLSKLNSKEPPSLKRKRAANEKSKMNGIANEDDFLSIYNQFKADWGLSQTKLPVWNGETMNLYKIFQTVQDHGGYIEVTKRRMWLTLRDGLFENNNAPVKSSGNLKLFYENYMLDFEMHLKTMKGKEIKRKTLHEITNHSAKLGAAWGQSKVPVPKILTSGKVDSGNELELLKSAIIFGPGGSDLCGELDNSDTVPQNTKLTRKGKTHSPSESLPEHTDYNDLSQDDCDSSPSLNHEEIDVLTISQNSVERQPESLDLAPKTNTMISSCDFVASSNPTSPEMFPVEGIKRRKSYGTRTCSPKEGAGRGQSKLPLPTIILSSGGNNAGNDLKLLKSTIFLPGWCDLSDEDSCLSHKEVDVSTISKNSSKSLYLGTKTNTMISNCDFVPSSNPNSPKVFPMEEDLENDCEISIRRELEEMESLLASLERTARKGNPVKRKYTKDEGLQENKNSRSSQDNEVKDAIRDIFEVEEHISQLKDSTELDFL